MTQHPLSSGYLNTLSIAARCHAGQVDKAGVPYWRHVDRVARRLLKRWPNSTLSEVQAALLHDVYEDTRATPASLKALRVSDDVLALVQRLTREPHMAYLDWIREIARKKNASVIRIKLADLADNMDPSRRHACYVAKLAARYQPASDILEAALADLQTAQEPAAQ